MRKARAVVSLAMLALAFARPAAAQKQPELAGSGSLVLSVESGRDAVEKIRNEIRAAGGQLVRATETQATLDIPRGSYPALVRRLRELGHLRSEQLTTEDVTDEIAEAEARARAARESYQRLEGSSATARDMNERVALERELEQTQRAAADAEARLRELERRATMIRIEVRLEAPPREGAIPEPRLPFPWLGELDLPRLLYSTSGPPAEEHYELRSFVDGAFELRGAWAPEPEKLDDTSVMLAAAASFRMLGESGPVGLWGGFDLVLGGGGGFWYGAQALFGLGLPIGSSFAVGVASGPGIDGVTGGVVPFGVPIPIELYLMLDVSSFMKASAWMRDGWVLASDEREGGSQLAPFGDELSAGLTLGFGDQGDGSYSRDRFGPTVGVAYRELKDTAIWELRLGWGASERSMSSAY